jgi:hypothetical protein
MFKKKEISSIQNVTLGKEYFQFFVINSKFI